MLLVETGSRDVRGSTQSPVKTLEIFVHDSGIAESRCRRSRLDAGCCCRHENQTRTLKTLSFSSLRRCMFVMSEALPSLRLRLLRSLFTIAESPKVGVGGVVWSAGCCCQHEDQTRTLKTLSFSSLRQCMDRMSGIASQAAARAAARAAEAVPRAHLSQRKPRSTVKTQMQRRGRQ